MRNERSGDGETLPNKKTGIACGFAAAHCGKALPFRHGLVKTSEAAPRGTRHSLETQSLKLVRKGGAFPLGAAAKPLVLLLALLLSCSAQISAQQIGNPTTQQGVTPPRGLYAIRNARIVSVSGPE